MCGRSHSPWVLTIVFAWCSAVLVGAAEGPGAAPGDKPPARAGAEKPGVMLGGKFVPRDKFLVFFLFGDSNTDGAGFQWYKDDWRSERAWHFSGRDKKWLPAQPGTPHSMDSKFNSPLGSVGFPFVKNLAQTYPDYHFGIVKATHGGSPFGFGAYDQYLGLLLKHGGQFIAQGVIMEGGQFDKQLYERLCRDFNNTLDKLALLATYQRYERTCQAWCEFRATPEMLADVRVFFGEETYQKRYLGRIAGGKAIFGQIEKKTAAFPRGANVNVEGLWLCDWTHMLRQDIWAERCANHAIARGWATPTARPDAEKPGVPGNLRVVKAWDTGVKLAWDEAKDNVAVEGYELFCDGKKVPYWLNLPSDLHLATTVFTEFPAVGLKPGTEYTFQVRARDYNDNGSELSPPVKVRTASAPALMQKFPVKINIGGDNQPGGGAIGDWLADKDYRDGEDYGRVVSRGRLLSESGGGHTNWTSRWGQKELGGAFGEGSPEQVVFGTGRGMPLFYKLRVPDGVYRATWYLMPAWLIWNDAKKHNFTGALPKDPPEKVGWRANGKALYADKLRVAVVSSGSGRHARTDGIQPISRILEAKNGELLLTWPIWTYDRAIWHAAALIVETAEGETPLPPLTPASVAAHREMARYGKDDVIAVISGTLTRRTPTRAAKDLAPYIHAFFTSEVAVTEVKGGRVPGDAKSVIVVSYGWRDRKRAEAADWKAGRRLDDLNLKSWQAQPADLKQQIVDDDLMDLSRPWFFVDLQREILDAINEEGPNGIDDEDVLDLR